MRLVALLLGIALCLGACAHRFKYSPQRDHGWYLRTDSAMKQRENPGNKSSTGVGIPGY